MSPPYEIKAEESIALVPVVVRVVIPPAMIQGLIGALQTEATKFKQDAEESGLTIPLMVSK